MTTDKRNKRIMTAKKSTVWDFYELLKKDGTEDKTLTVWNICKTQLKYLSGSTSSIVTHLLRRHGITLSKTKGVNRQNVKQPLTGQIRLPEALGLKNKYSRSSTRHADITSSIGVFIAKDMRPFSVLENRRFVDMISVLDPKYDMPGRSHYSEKVIPKLHDDTKSKVSQEPKKAEFIALTTDSWTSRATQSYITYSILYPTWNLENESSCFTNKGNVRISYIWKFIWTSKMCSKQNIIWNYFNYWNIRKLWKIAYRSLSHQLTPVYAQKM